MEIADPAMETLATFADGKERNLQPATESEARLIKQLIAAEYLDGIEARDKGGIEFLCLVITPLGSQKLLAKKAEELDGDDQPEPEPSMRMPGLREGLIGWLRRHGSDIIVGIILTAIGLIGSWLL